MTDIVYNGQVVQSISNGQIATLPVRNKQMATDIKIVIPSYMASQLVVQYNDETVKTTEPGNVVTLPIAMLRMSTDITIMMLSVTSNFLLSDGSALLTSDGQIFNVKEG